VTAIVVDASAALKLVRDEPGRVEVRQQLRARTLAGEPILVPSVFWLEVVNVLALRYRYPPPAVVEAVYELERIGLATAELGRPGVLAVIDAVSQHGLTAYDAAYLVLVESAEAMLVTADTSLAAAAGDRAILVGDDGGVAEPFARYVPAPSWASWSGAAAYLRELRAAL